MWQTCDKCDNEIYFEWTVDVWIWDLLPKEDRKRKFCIDCFLGKLNKPEFGHLTNKININDFHFLSIVTPNFSSILWDKDYDQC